jgi:hypothetical protein
MSKPSHHQVDKDTKYMHETYGTTCLISEAGRADRLLELAHKRRVNLEKYVKQPLDSWDI